MPKNPFAAGDWGTQFTAETKTDIRLVLFPDGTGVYAVFGREYGKRNHVQDITWDIDESNRLNVLLLDGVPVFELCGIAQTTADSLIVDATSYGYGVTHFWRFSDSITHEDLQMVAELLPIVLRAVDALT